MVNGGRVGLLSHQHEMIKMEKNAKIILASSSPRRKQILENMGLSFEIIPSDYEENLDSNEFSYEKIEDFACKKAGAVLDKVDKNSLIIGADTIVVLENEVLGKPQDEKEALNMLTRLSGKRHFVVTSVCVLRTKDLKKLVKSTTSFVEFEKLRPDMIESYVQKYGPLDKAGAYGIQELPEGFVKSIEGSFENIIGLCPEAVKDLLNEIEK